AACYRESARVQLDTARTEAGLATYQRAIALLEPFTAAAGPERLNFVVELATRYSDLGVEQEKQGQLAEALRAHQPARALREQLLAADPRDARFRRDVAASLANLGMLHYRRNEGNAALEFFKQNQVLMDGLVRERPDNSEFRSGLATARGRLG